MQEESLPDAARQRHSGTTCCFSKGCEFQRTSRLCTIPEWEKIHKLRWSWQLKPVGLDRSKLELFSPCPYPHSFQGWGFDIVITQNRHKTKCKTFAIAKLKIT